MLFANIDILDETLTYHQNYYVGVRGKKIAYISPWKPREDFGMVYNGTGKLLMSGFYNAHGHSAMTLLRGYADNMRLPDWLDKKIFPFEAQMDADAVYCGTMLATAEMLRFGIVSVSDMYIESQAVLRAASESGIKMNFAPASICTASDEKEKCRDYRKDISDLLRAYHCTDDRRLQIDLAIHSEYATTQLMVEEVAGLAKDHALRLQMHLSETRAEHESCKVRHTGKTPTQFFYDVGAFDNPTTAAHCVWVETKDVALLQEKNVTVSCCPVSNLKLVSGFCPVHTFLKKNINVALGTDGTASNNNLDLLEEIKLFSMLYNTCAEDPAAILPKDALAAATRAGALAQGRDDCGALRIGNRADLIVLDLRNKAHLHPIHDAGSGVVFSAQGSDVCLTMVDGEILYQDGEYTTIDLERVLFSAEREVSRILKQL